MQPDEIRQKSWQRLDQFLNAQRSVISSPAELNRLRMMLAQSERDATQCHDWSLLSLYWLQHFAMDGLEDAVRCTEQCELAARYVVHYLQTAEAWHSVSDFDASYLPRARRALEKAEKLNCDSEELALTAGVWNTIFGSSEMPHIESLMAKAERTCKESWHIDTVASQWFRILGGYAARPRVRNFLANFIEKYGTDPDFHARHVAAQWLSAGDGQTYHEWLTRAREDSSSSRRGGRQ